MKVINQFLQEANTDIKVGDIILAGKWRNKRCVVKGFGKDKNGQPTIKTDRGEYSMYKFRVNNLLPKDMQVQNELTPDEEKE